MRTSRILIAILIVVAALCFIVVAMTKETLAPDSQASSQITFPAGGETLIKGQTYTLQWTGGPEPTQIFLIDTSLKSAGASVSISDRIYGIKNTGSYVYKVPTTVKDGIYEFQIGNKTSKTFEIKSLGSADPYTPKRMTLSGTYVCLPHKDTSGPQTLECALGLKADNGKYYALDFNLMSQTRPNLKTGDRITATGIMTPVENLSSDHWKVYPITGIFSITDSLKVQ